MKGSKWRVLLLLAGILIVSLVIQGMMIHEGFEDGPVENAPQNPQPENKPAETPATPAQAQATNLEKMKHDMHHKKLETELSPPVKSNQFDQYQKEHAENHASLENIVDQRIRMALEKIPFKSPPMEASTTAAPESTMIENPISNSLESFSLYK